MVRQKLTEREIEAQLKELKDWALSNGKLLRQFEFKNFQEAFAFMTEVAFIAEKMDHHPDWSNVYSRVRIELQTHDCKGISDLDFTLGKQINRVFDRFQA